ncbi:MAG TPA: 2'-5' RNA ligase family protein [Pilimelia sp.]|nr:2'-5' RNA ligase family protein [Pilimelia sp.]
MIPSGPDAAAPPLTESAVLVAVPEAEDAVGRFRARLDRSAAWGVPPHVTVLYPFVGPDRLAPPVLDRLAAAISEVPAFGVTLARLSWSGDDDVLWLVPEPDDPFRALTAAVWREFPDHPPYGGIHPDPTPHLTIGHDAPIDVLREAAEAIRPLLPIRARVTTAHLMRGSPAAGAWHTVAALPLAATDATRTA